MSLSPLSVNPVPLTPVGPVEPPWILQTLASWSNPATTTAPFVALTGINIYYGLASTVDVGLIGVQALLLFLTAKYAITTQGQALTPTMYDALISSTLILTAIYAIFTIVRVVRA